MFILELTLRSWNHSEENKRRTLQRNDIAAAITRTDIFDFLVSKSRAPLILRFVQKWLMSCLISIPLLPTSSCTVPSGQLLGFNITLSELQVDIVPREERDDAAMMPRVPQPMTGAMPGKLHCTVCLQHVRMPLEYKACHASANKMKPLLVTERV